MLNNVLMQIRHFLYNSIFINKAPELIEILVRESDSMIRHLLHNGIPFDINYINKIAQVKIEKIIENKKIVEGHYQEIALIHADLTQACSPYTPAMIHNYTKAKAHLGGIGLLLAFFFIAFIVTSLNKHVTYKTLSRSTLDMYSEPTVGFYNLMFLVALSGIGACFSILFRINNSIVADQRDNHYKKNDTYGFTQILLGIVSAIVITNFTSVDDLDTALQSSILINATPQSTYYKIAYWKMVLALLAGFSAQNLYIILYLVNDRVLGTVQKIIANKGGNNQSKQIKNEENA